MKTIKDFDLKNKRVLVRCDFNVPQNNKGEIEDDFRIRQIIPTIEYLVKNEARVILMSHLGEPGGKVEESLRLNSVQKKLEDLLKKNIAKTDDCIGKQVENVAGKMKNGEILLLENLRFHKGEEENDPKFAEKLALIADIYVNDAFSVCHRAHASVSAITKFLPHRAGLLLDKEIKVLSRVLENPWRPLVAIVGGAKIETKIKTLKNLLEKSDHILIGGKIANSILLIKGIWFAGSLPSKEAQEEVKKLNLTSPKVHLPIDVAASPNEKGDVYIRYSAPATVLKDEMALDIGPETIDIFGKIIKEAKMIIWSGPMGLFESAPFERGTKEIAEKIMRNHKAYKIIGGGDTISAIAKFGLVDKFDHISTGGGAMLAFLGGEKMPGIESLKS
jgi:3-phosphoglycerate kinase